MAALDAHLVKPGGPVRGPAGMVVGEDPAGELVQTTPLGLRAQRGKQLAAQALPPAVGVDVDGVLADALVDTAVRVEPGPCPAQDPPVALGDDERAAVGQPGGDVGGRARPRLEGRDALADPRVVGRDDVLEIVSGGEAGGAGGRQ